MKIRVTGFKPNSKLIVNYDSGQQPLTMYLLGQAVKPVTDDDVAPINELFNNYGLPPLEKTYYQGNYNFVNDAQKLVFLIDLFLKVSTNELNLLNQNSNSIKLSSEEKSEALKALAVEISTLFNTTKHQLPSNVKLYYQNEFYPCFKKSPDCASLFHVINDQQNIAALLKWLELKETRYNTIIEKRSYHATDNQRLHSLSHLKEMAKFIQHEQGIANKYLMLVGCLLSEINKTEVKHNSNGIISRFFTSSNLVDTYKSVLKQQKQTLKELGYDIDKKNVRQQLRQAFEEDYGNHHLIAPQVNYPNLGK